ncbi:MAG: hypothetical protein Q8S58_18310, partial [Bosea sp. (in: a-proteobacteria)]|nr:hypothetical protein [Bosea sp. (in: a-proteobacteria)]
LPDDAGHLVAVHVDDRVGDLDLAHVKRPLLLARREAFQTAARAPQAVGRFLEHRPAKGNAVFG